MQDKQLQVDYRWKKKRWHSIGVNAVNQPKLIIQGSKEEFITQHFWGYSKKKRYTSEYQVDHELWKSYPVLEYAIDVDYTVNYGGDFAALTSTTPESVFLVEGSAVRVFKDRKIL